MSNERMGGNTGNQRETSVTTLKQCKPHHPTQLHMNLPYMSVFVYVLMTANDITGTMVPGRYVSVHKTRTAAVDAASELPYPTFIQEEMLEDVFNTKQVMEHVFTGNCV